MHNQHSKNNSEIDENIKQEISYILTYALPISSEMPAITVF